MQPPSTFEMVLISLTIANLLASGYWTDRRFARFDHLPAHYGLLGRPTRYAPRRTVAWLLPVVFSIMLIVVSTAISFVPTELKNGDPETATIIMCAALLGSQGLVIWLHGRWASEQE